jgi:hypothetical protein
MTSGNRIKSSHSMQPILLRGVNRSGLEYAEPSDRGFLAAAGFTEEEVREMVLNWGSNVIRVPFNQDWALHGRRGHSAAEYLEALDQVISWAAALGAYTILDLQWLDADTVYGHTRRRNHPPRRNHVAPLPDAHTIVLWRTLAERYRDEPAVLFDLFNEPHNPLGDDSLPIHVIGPDGAVVESASPLVGAGEWVPWAELLVAEVRAIRPDGLILIGGVDWAFDLREICVNAPGVVYSAHIYPNHKPETWWKALGRSFEVPIFIGEWGGEADHLDFGQRLAERIRREGLSWTAWSWADRPHLIHPSSEPGYTPTAFGELVRNQLRTA